MKATGLIPVDQLSALITDLILNEIAEVKLENEDDNVLFNLRLKPSLVIYAKMERKVDMEDEINKSISKSYKLK